MNNRPKKIVSDEVVQESESRAGKLKPCREVVQELSRCRVLDCDCESIEVKRGNQCTTLQQLLSIRFIEYALSHTARGGKLKNEKSRIKWTKILEPKNEKTKRSDHLRYPTPKRVKYDVFYRA